MTTGTRPFLNAVYDSTPSGQFEDTKIILYSRRDADGNVYGPKELYANSDSLKTVEYFHHSKPYSSFSQCTKHLIPSK